MGGYNLRMDFLLANQIEQRAEEAARLYHRLILLVGPPGSGKTPALQTVQERTGAPLVNASLELARRMLELTASQRARRIGTLLGDLVDESQTDGRGSGEDRESARGPACGMVLLDNIEIVFDPSLCQDPLPLLLGTSRNTVVVVAWPGVVADGWLSYAEPGHPEHYRYRVAEYMTDSMVVSAEATRAAGSVIDPHSSRESLL